MLLDSFVVHNRRRSPSTQNRRQNHRSEDGANRVQNRGPDAVDSTSKNFDSVYGYQRSVSSLSSFECRQIPSRGPSPMELYSRTPSRGPPSRGPSPSPSLYAEQSGFIRKDVPLSEEKRASKRSLTPTTESRCQSGSIADILSEKLRYTGPAVRTPRVPGDEIWRVKEDKDDTPLSETLNKEGLTMNVPNYLVKLTGGSRVGVRAIPHLKVPHSCSTRKSKSRAAHRVKSTTLASITVPVSAKQWLLQAIGLKDLEIREMFDQMESNPQLAAEYVREVRAEWEAMEFRESKVPHEASFLVKDRALLEKIRELILKFIESTSILEENGMPPENRISKGIDRDPSQKDSFVANDDSSHHIEVGKGKESYKDGQYNISDLRPPPSAASKSLEFGTENFSRKIVCGTCGQVKENISQSIEDQGDSPQENASFKSPLRSFIPVEDYVINKYVVQPGLLGKSECKSTYSPFDKRWYTVLFPALQPGKREDVQLLGHWLQYAIRRNSCENPDGRFTDIESAFILHSIAFLEIVRQVDIHCEERGSLLLHLWRQLLRIFNQVMVRAEPKLNASEEELRQLRDSIKVEKEAALKLTSDFQYMQSQYVALEQQFKTKEVEVGKMQRCRLCRADNLTPRSKEAYIKRFRDRTAPRFSPSELAKVESSEALSEEELKKKAEELTKQIEGISEKGTDGITDAEVDAEMLGELLKHDKKEELAEALLLDQEIEAPPGCHHAHTQTDDSMGLRRCHSAPAHIFPPTKIAESGKDETKPEIVTTEEGKEPQVKMAELTSDDLALIQAMKGGTADTAAKTTEGGEGGDERLKNFETLAVDTIELLDKIPIVEGALATGISGLMQRYSELTGYILAEKAREKYAQAAEIKPGEPQDIDKSKRPSRRQTSKGSKSVTMKSYVPLGFAKIMKIYNPPKNVKFFNIRQLGKLIGSVYLSKIVADQVDDSCNNDRQTCCEFVYDFMLNQYGLKGLSESAIFGVFKTIKTLITNREIEKHHKIRLFSRFCGMEEHNSLTEPDLYLYLKLVQKASIKVGVLLPSDQDDGIWFLNAPQYLAITDEPNLIAYFGSQAAATTFIEKYIAKNAVTEKASPEIRKLVKESEVRKVEWDLMLETILNLYPTKLASLYEKRKMSMQVRAPVPKEKAQELENLFIAGDANQDGVLTFSEFREIISSADPSISSQNALRMFRETITLMTDGGDSISPQAFAIIAYNHGIAAPPSVVFDLLKKTWNQVQGDINMDKIAENKEEFEFTKDALVEMMQQRIDVNVAVQTFRQFVLNYCGKDAGEANEQAEQGDQGEQDETDAAEGDDGLETIAE